MSAAPATDREIYAFARRRYSPALAIRVRATLLQDTGFARAVRRSWQHEVAQHEGRRALISSLHSVRAAGAQQLGGVTVDGSGALPE